LENGVMSFKSIVEMFKYDSSEQPFMEEAMRLAKAEELMSQIEARTKALQERLEKADGIKVGSMVSWGSSGGTAKGKVVRVKSEGSINVPDSSFSIKAEEDNPAVLIRIYKDGKPTETLVGHKMNTLNKA
jgi:hypothetical protein